MSITFRRLTNTCFALIISTGYISGVHADENSRYNFGHAATADEISRIDIDVRPDGQGAPPGQGNYSQGKQVYADRCAACHGIDMSSPVKGTGASALRGGRASLTSGNPKKTVESYWPYASTLFDYIKRAMPFNAPGSLNDNEIYAVVCYILAEGNIIDHNTVMNAKTIGKIKMPNRNGFIPDARPEKFSN